MADLKTGTTIGGALVWTQGNFPLYPTGDTLLYKTFKVYSEFDKPQAVDNDFVSKADGGEYLKTTSYAKGIRINGSVAVGGEVAAISLYGNYVGGRPSYGMYMGHTTDDGSHGVVPSGAAFYLKIANTTGWIFRNANTPVASINSVGAATFTVVNADLQPTNASHLTRKDYVDGLINTTTANANSRVLRAGDTMTGNLTAPNFISVNLATANNHVPQLGQVVARGVILDYGTY